MDETTSKITYIAKDRNEYTVSVGDFVISLDRTISENRFFGFVKSIDLSVPNFPKFTLRYAFEDEFPRMVNRIGSTSCASCVPFEQNLT